MSINHVLTRWAELTTDTQTLTSLMPAVLATKGTEEKLRTAPPALVDKKILDMAEQSFETLVTLVPSIKDPALLRRLAKHPTLSVRRAVAQNPHISEETFCFLFRKSLRSDFEGVATLKKNTALTLNLIEELNEGLRPSSRFIDDEEWCGVVLRQENVKDVVLDYARRPLEPARLAELAKAVAAYLVPNLSMAEFLETLSLEVNREFVLRLMLLTHSRSATFSILDRFPALPIVQPDSLVKDLCYLARSYVRLSPTSSKQGAGSQGANSEKEITEETLVTRTLHECLDATHSDVLQSSTRAALAVAVLVRHVKSPTTFRNVFNEMVKWQQSIASSATTTTPRPGAVRLYVSDELCLWLQQTSETIQLSEESMLAFLELITEELPTPAANFIVSWARGKFSTPPSPQTITDTLAKLPLSHTALSVLCDAARENDALLDCVIAALGPLALTGVNEVLDTRVAQRLHDACAFAPTTSEQVLGLLPSWTGTLDALIATAQELSLP